MGKRIDDYIENLSRCLTPYIKGEDARTRLDEIRAHLEDSAADNVSDTSLDEAESQAVQKFGNPKAVAWQMIGQSRKHSYWSIGRWLLVFTSMQMLPFVCYAWIYIEMGLIAAFFSTYLLVKPVRRTIRPFIAPVCAFVALSLIAAVTFPFFQEKPDFMVKLALSYNYAVYGLLIIGIVRCTVRSHVSVFKCAVLPGLICLVLSIAGQVALKLPVLPETSLRQVQSRITGQIDGHINYLSYRIREQRNPDYGNQGTITKIGQVTETHELAGGGVFKVTYPRLEFIHATKAEVLEWTRTTAPTLVYRLEGERIRLQQPWSDEVLADTFNRREILNKLIEWTLSPKLTQLGLQYLISLIVLLFVKAGYRLRTNQVKPVSQ